MAAGPLFLCALAWGAGDIRLESGSTLTVADVQHSRILPHAFHDQALSSLPRLFPGHVLLASRRSGVLGEVAYALVCYKESPASERVVIQVNAVHRDRAWSLDAIAPASYGDTLVQVLEQVGKLPSTPDTPRTPEGGRR